MAYDVVIKNGTVVDGTGRQPYRADVAVQGDRIAEVGKITDAAKRTIDAEGHIVTPGFVDIHTHLDAQIFWDPDRFLVLLAWCYVSGHGQLRGHVRAVQTSRTASISPI